MRACQNHYVPRVSPERLQSRRREILAGARACFARHGYEGATVRRLEEEIGLSRGAIFHHFRDKESLFFAVAEDDAVSMADTVAKHGLVQVMRDLAAEADSPETTGWLGTQLEVNRRLRTEAGFAREWEDRKQAIAEATRQRLARQLDAGTLRDDLPVEVLAGFLELAYDGLITHLAMGSNASNLDAILDMVETAVRRRLSSPLWTCWRSVSAFYWRSIDFGVPILAVARLESGSSFPLSTPESAMRVSRTVGLFARALTLTMVACGTVTVMSTSTASAAPDPANFSLTRADTSAPLLSGLDDALDNRTVPQVLDSANRTGTACTAPMSNRAASFCWQSGDNTVKYWIPQGLTTSADATGGAYEGRNALLSAWYDNTTGTADRGARISFVDMSNTTTPKYRHVLLVEPTGTPEEPSYQAIDTHAGGLVWYGDKLYVCDTFNGLRVFDMKYILAANNMTDNLIGRQSDGSYASRGYAYVMPQVAKYNPTSTGGEAKLRFSQVSVDRTSDKHSLIVSEWDAVGDETRMVRFDLDADGTITPDGDGVARGDWAYKVGFRSMQGATAVNGVYYVHRNSTSGKGGLMKWKQGSNAEIFDDTLPRGPEDVSFWVGKDQLWGQTEHVGTRYVFASKLSAW